MNVISDDKIIYYLSKPFKNYIHLANDCNTKNSTYKRLKYLNELYYSKSEYIGNGRRYSGVDVRGHNYRCIDRRWYSLQSTNE